MYERELKRLTGLLEEACHRSRRSRRDLERSLGVGHGYLSHLFAGRIDLKVRHVFELAHELGLDPGQFMRAAFDEEEPVPAPATAAPEARRPTAPRALPSRPDRTAIKGLLREIVREELMRLAGEEPEPEEEETGDAG